MDWSNELWIKVYLTDTVEWMLLSWQAQGLFLLILRKINRAGVLELGRAGKKGLAMKLGGVANWPAMEPFLDELLKDGCVRIEGTQLLVPNFAEAQSTPMSARARKQVEYAKRRAGIGTKRAKPTTTAPAAPPPAPSSSPRLDLPWDDVVQTFLTASGGKFNLLHTNSTLQREFLEQCVACAVTLDDLRIFAGEVMKNPQAIWPWLTHTATPRVFTLEWLRRAEATRGETLWTRFSEGLKSARALHTPTRAPCEAPVVARAAPSTESRTHIAARASSFRKNLGGEG